MRVTQFGKKAEFRAGDHRNERTATRLKTGYHDVESNGSRTIYTCQRCFREFESQIDYIDHLIDIYNGYPVPASDAQLKFYAKSEPNDSEKRAFEYTAGRAPPTRPFQESSVAEEIRKSRTQKKKDGDVASKLLYLLLADV